MLSLSRDRVIYRHNPLTSVICQLRFPLDLRMDVIMPAEFQQRIRAEYPLAHEDLEGQGLAVPDDISQHFPQELLDVLSTRINRRFQFMTRDRIATITLTNSFVALETNNYVRWEDFRRNLELMLDAVTQTYQVNFFTRIGLRYQNVIDRTVLGLENSPWNTLVSDLVLGPLVTSESSESVYEHNGTFLIQLENSDEVARVRYGLVTEKAGDPSNVMFMLDHDFFTKNDVETEVDDVIKRVNVFNTSNRGLFRRCITAKLHDAMVPETANH
ncbi:MAG: TIGR04255 family protein [Chloroflexi bacterium]|nr:TIGR04255 family protein [Chloroflexota bacterium]